MIHVLLMVIGLWMATPVEKVTAVVDLRGVSVREAFEKLSQALEERIVIAREVPAEMVDGDIRLHTEHLSPEQSVRWVARLAGLEAVHTQEGYYVATADHLLKLGTSRQGTESSVMSGTAGRTPNGGSIAAKVNGQPIAELAARRGPVFWQDTPLSRVSSDVARVFKIDLIFHEDVLSSESLISWEQPDTSLQDACNLLAHELKAIIELRDGALWVRPVDLQEQAAAPTSLPAAAETQPATVVENPGVDASSLPAAQSQPAIDSALPIHQKEPPLSDQDLVAAQLSPPPATQPSHARSNPPQVIYRADGTIPPSSKATHTIAPLRPEPPRHRPDAARSLPGHITVDASIRDWSALARHVEMATGGSCRVRESGRRYEPMEINGSTSQVLEALKLMGKLDYRIEPAPAGGAPSVELLIALAR